MADAEEQFEVEADVLVAPGNRWQPDSVRALIDQYFIQGELGGAFQPEDIELIRDLIVQAFEEVAEDYEVGDEVILSIPGIPFPVSFGTNPFIIGENLYTWTWVPPSILNPELVFDANLRLEFANEFAEDLMDLDLEAMENLPPPDPDDAGLPVVPGVPLDEDVPQGPPAPREGGALLRNGVMFKPKRRFYGE